jgi:hypothetical protein
MKSFHGSREPCDGADILRACAKDRLKRDFFQLRLQVEYSLASCVGLPVDLHSSLWDGHEFKRFVLYAQKCRDSTVEHSYKDTHWSSSVGSPYRELSRAIRMLPKR